MEFIADARKTKLELLESLYNIVNQYENAYIMTSCRTSDKTAFFKIESKYNIITYDVHEISENELEDLKKQYPIIKKISQDKKYEELLKTPFYINIIIKNCIDFDNITDVNKFREYIWNNIICLKNKQKKYEIDIKDVEEAVNKIVFDRAKKFTLGINENCINSNILYALKTEGIINCNKDGIRLKYDIYEDICFEIFFDREYFDCKAKYEVFYENITKIGRCVYRRYQIWISNKLLAKENRDKFIYNLIFNNEISEEWKKQTEIGIVKSNYSDFFFEENELEILEKDLLLEFIDIINLYSYETKIMNNDEFSDVQLISVGVGRENIIKIIEKNDLLEKNIIKKSKIIKLCYDYINQKKKKADICKIICKFMQLYIESAFENISQNWFKILDEIDKCLIIIFRLSNYCKEWLISFFDRMVSYYNDTETSKVRIAEDVIEFIMKNSYPKLVMELPGKLCEMASIVWKEKESDNEFYYAKDNPYGLSENYHYSYPDIRKNTFLWNIFRCNFWVGIEWAIKFLNECVEKYAQNYPQYVKKTKIMFLDEKNIVREYYGNSNMWMSCTGEYHIHDLVSDIVYNIKEAIINYFDENIHNKEALIFLENIKNKIYKESNNVILLTIIENIGLHYQNELPGFALDLISSIDIVEWDISRYASYIKNPQLEILKQQIFQKIGVPRLKNRYIIDPKCGISMEYYVHSIQINKGKAVKEKCYKILDYLYTIVNNDEENASSYLQIQKMDLRNAKTTQINENTISIEANITGEAQKVIDKHAENTLITNEFLEKIKKYCNEIKEGKDCSKSWIDFADELIIIKNNKGVMATGIEKIIISLVVKILQEGVISTEKKNYYCNYWIEGMEQILENKGFAFEPILISKLIEQLYSDVSIDIKNKIKLIILKFIDINYYDGIIDSIQREIIKYLQKDIKLSNTIFNTVIMLSNDEMEHQKYNAEYAKRKNNTFKFVPNKIPKLRGIDKQIEQENGEKYKSNTNEIIEKYLYAEEEINIKQFDISNYDLEVLCHISNCGKKFDDVFFTKVIREILELMISIKNDNSNSYRNNIIDTHQEYEIIRLFERELTSCEHIGENIIDLLFNNINFSEFKKDAIEIYQEILNCFTALYFDSHNDRNIRVMIEKKIKYIEQKIKKIPEEIVKKELYSCLHLSPKKYTRWEPGKFKTKYEYRDKRFLNEYFCKYGKYNIKDSMKTLYLLKIDELLPEILISVNEILIYNVKHNKNIESALKGDVQKIIDIIITKAFVNFSDEIKKDDDLINAYEGILKILIELNYEKAGVIIDEFRIH